MELDEEATVAAIAATGIWQLIIRPTRGRWLDITLVVEQSPTMRIWQETALEFRQLLLRACAPRSLLTFNLYWSPKRLLLQTSGGRPVHNHAPCHGSGSRLIMVLSDAMGFGWLTADIPELLSQWASIRTTTLVQMLPQSMWNRSALRHVPLVTPNQPRAPTNTRVTKDVWPPVIVTTVDPEYLRRFSRMLAGGVANGVPAYRGSRSQFEVVKASSVQGRETFNAQALSRDQAEKLFRRFERFSSSEALKLARHLASAPLVLPVMRLVQRVLVPDAAPAHLAEIFLSGILYRRGQVSDIAAPPNQVEYEFLPGVRERLLDLGGLDCMFETIGLLCRYLEQRFGKGGQFTALLVDPNANAREWNVAAASPGLEPFTRVASFLLERLGLANNINASIAETTLDEVPHRSGEKPASVPQQRGVLSSVQPTLVPIRTRFDIYISYARGDNANGRITELVERIKRDFAPFANRDLVPFFDRQEIHGLQDWRQHILQGLRESRLLLACLSPAYLKSEYCAWEFVEFLKYEISHLHGFNGILPVYFVDVPGWDSKEFERQCGAWVAELRKRQFFDLRQWYEHGDEALREPVVQDRMSKLNRQIVQTITRGERAEKCLGNVDAHNPHFVGRTANLRMLRENFVTPGHIGVVTAVNGVGGLGKTALAIEYAHAFADEYGGGCWQVRCAGKDDLRLALAELATPIGFEFTDDEKKNADLQVERVRRELKKLADAREPHRCLLLLDNVDRPGLLDPTQVARLNGGDWLHVLATTRLGENEMHGAHRDRLFLAIDELPPDDALALIESYQPDGRFRSEAEREAARDIVRLLGCFTLAVESAAVCLGQFANDVTCAAFLAGLKNEGLEGLDTAASRSSEGALHGEKRLGATLRPTIERLNDAEKLALTFAAFLPPDQVPLPWLRALVAKTFPEMERDSEPGHQDSWKNLLRRLLSLRLLHATSEMDAKGHPVVAQVHRVVQRLMFFDCPSAEKAGHQQAIEELIRERDAFFERVTDWIAARWELEPLTALAGMWDETEHPQTAWLMNQVGIRWHHLAEWSRAEPLMRRALAINEKNFGPEHPEVARDLNNLAQLLQATNRLGEAEPLIRRALAIDERSFGPEHPEVAVGLGNLAQLLQAANRLGEAEPLLRRALAIDESSFGSEHPTVARDLNNLAQLLQATNRLSEAEPLMRRAVETLINISRFTGHQHPHLEIIFKNYAGLLQGMGRTQEGILAQLQSMTPDSRILLTTRDAGLVTTFATHGNRYRVERPTLAEAQAILGGAANLRPDQLPPIADEIIKECDRLPLALALCGGMVHSGSSWSNVLAALQEHDLEFLSSEHPDEALHQIAWKAMDISLRLLPVEEQQRFAELAVFGADTSAPDTAVATLWQHTAGLNPRQTEVLLSKFSRRSLVQRPSAADGNVTGHVNLHDLLHHFASGIAIKQFGSVKAIHQRLLNAYRAKCSDGWASGPNDGYLFQHLAYHLKLAGRIEELRQSPELREFLILRGTTTLRGHEHRVKSVAFSPDGHRVLSGSDDKTMRMWDTQNGEALVVLRGHKSSVTSVAFSPDSRQIVSGSRDGTLRLWDAQTGQELAVLRGHDGRSHSVAFSPDGRRVLSGSSDKTVRLWNAQSGRELAVLHGHESSVESVAFSPDGRYVVSGSDDETVRLWDAQSGRELALLRGHKSSVTSVAFLPDGRRILSGSKDLTLRVWDAQYMQEVAVLRGSTSEIQSVACSSDGLIFASAAMDGIVRFWDTSLALANSTQVHIDVRVNCIAFSFEGRRLVAGLSDGTVKILPLDALR